MIKTIVEDNFFHVPNEVRQFALSLNYQSCTTHLAGGNWPGKRSNFVNIINPSIFDTTMSKINDLCGYQQNHNSFTDMFFQYCTASDGDSWIHRDRLEMNATHVGLIYLTPNPPPNSGTILYENTTDEDDPEDPSKYKVKQVLDNVYNRIVIYDPNEYHKSDTYFGTTLSDSRLFIVFFSRMS